MIFAYSDSPAASSASARSWNIRRRVICPFSTVYTNVLVAVTSRRSPATSPAQYRVTGWRCSASGAGAGSSHRHGHGLIAGAMTAGRLECFLDRSKGCVRRVRFDPELLTAVGLVSASLAPDALVGEASDRTLREGAATADDERRTHCARSRPSLRARPICSPEWTLGAAASESIPPWRSSWKPPQKTGSWSAPSSSPAARPAARESEGESTSPTPTARRLRRVRF
jgi:hypothetical protein